MKQSLKFLIKKMRLSVWKKIEIPLWKCKSAYPTWHVAITMILSMIVAALAGYVIIVYVAPWFGLSISWDDTNTNYETLFVLLSYAVGAAFFTFIISFLNAEKISKVLRQFQNDGRYLKQTQHWFEVSSPTWASLKKYDLAFLGFDIDHIDSLNTAIKKTDISVIPTDYASFLIFKNETGFLLCRTLGALISFSTQINEVKEKVARANKVADAIRELSNFWLLGIITATIDYEDYYSKDEFPNDHIKLLLRYLEEGGDEPIVHSRNTHDEIIISQNIFEKISQGLSLHQKRFLKTHYLDSYLPAIKINPFSTIPEWLKEWKEL